MIDMEILFDEIKSNMAFNCPECQDGTDLIHIASGVVSRKIPLISVNPDAVEQLWTWLEGRPTKIIARFAVAKSKKATREKDVSNLSQQINHAFKKGAGGAHIYISLGDLDWFVNELRPVRDGLFFNKDLCIALDIAEINATDWTEVFSGLDKIKADTLLLHLPDNKKAAQDFVGRIYGLLENFNPDFTGELHFSLNDDYQKIEQVWRLVEKMRPEISPRLKFFVGN